MISVVVIMCTIFYIVRNCERSQVLDYLLCLHSYRSHPRNLNVNSSLAQVLQAGLIADET